MKNAPKKSMAHVRYKDSQGNLVPGATTICNLLAKPQLIVWANRLGLDGIDSTRYVDELSEIGTLAHTLILHKHKGEIPDLKDYTDNQIDAAENCMNSYWAWEKNHTIEPILMEEPLVSDEMQYGGTLDMYCKLDGVHTLLDFKTGKALYPEHTYQLAAYRELLTEQGYPVERCMILRIGRDMGEGFEVHEGKDMDTAFAIFRHLLGIYHTTRYYWKEQNKNK